MSHEGMDPQDDDAWWIYRGLDEAALEAERASSQGLARPTDAASASPVTPALSEHVRTRLRPETAPPWRRFDRAAKEQRGAHFIVDDDVISRVNAALVLRRPLLVTGPPGTGKTALTYAVARELGLGPVLRWSITSRTELRDGLYSYDAIARLQDTQRHFGTHPGPGQNPANPRRFGLRHRAMPRPPGIEDYLKLGPLGSAFVGFSDEERADYPRVLLIDEIDKSDIDLPNDLLHIFEEGTFEIPELKRDPTHQHRVETADGDRACVLNGQVECRAFPFIVMTSNSEREFPAPFLRRCIQLEMQRPDPTLLARIVEQKLAQLDPEAYDRHAQSIREIIDAFCEVGKQRDLATDQLLQVILLRMKDIDPFGGVSPLSLRDHGPLINALWKSLREDQP
jgi:MoxR-like ATPase